MEKKKTYLSLSFKVAHNYETRSRSGAGSVKTGISGKSGQSGTIYDSRSIKKF